MPGWDLWIIMFEENTEILTVYDGKVKLKDLKENTLVYTWNKETKLMEVTKVKAIKSYLVDEIATIEFDSGLRITGSIYAELVVFRGKPIKLIDINIGQSIRAFTLSLHPGDGHWRVHGWVDGKAKHQYLARMVWEYYYGKIEGDLILHHKDFNKTNNFIDNLELLTNSQHSTIHWFWKEHHPENHKVTFQYVFPLVNKAKFLVPVLDTCGYFIIPDEKAIAGDFTGIVAKGSLYEI